MLVRYRNITSPKNIIHLAIAHNLNADAFRLPKYMCSNHFAQVDDDAHTFRGLKSFQSLLKDLVRLKVTSQLPLCHTLLQYYYYHRTSYGFLTPFFVSIALGQNSARRLRGNIIQKIFSWANPSIGFLCRFCSSFRQISKDQACQMANDFLRMATTFNLSPVVFPAAPVYGTFNLPTVVPFFFCVTNKLCLFLPHQNCKWGCAKIEQILKINNKICMLPLYGGMNRWSEARNGLRSIRNENQ